MYKKEMKRVAIFMFLVPIDVLAEVSDKMATQLELWITGLISSIVLAVMLRWSKWLNIIAIPVTALFFYFSYDTLTQPYIGPAIIKEQGNPYIFALYGSAVLVLMGVFIGNLLNKRRSNNA